MEAYTRVKLMYLWRSSNATAILRKCTKTLDTKCITKTSKRGSESFISWKFASTSFSSYFECGSELKTFLHRLLFVHVSKCFCLQIRTQTLCILQHGKWTTPNIATIDERFVNVRDKNIFKKKKWIYNSHNTTSKRFLAVYFIYETAHTVESWTVLHNADTQPWYRVLCFMSVFISQIVISGEQQAFVVLCALPHMKNCERTSYNNNNNEKNGSVIIIKPDNNLNEWMKKCSSKMSQPRNVIKESQIYARMEDLERVNRFSYWPKA